LWTPGGERFTHQLLEQPFDTDNGYAYGLRVAYRLYESEIPLFQYWIDGLPGERRSHEVNLSDRQVTFNEVATGLREIRDPVGACLRNMPYDLAPIGDSALLLAVTDTDASPSETPFFLHIWTPPFPSVTPPQPAQPLASVLVRIGEMLNSPDAQRLGRISHRDGKFLASLRYTSRSTSMVDDFMTPEVPFRVKAYSISGAIWPQLMVLSTQRDMAPFLEEEFFYMAPTEPTRGR
jgi:hypothetical protein